MKKSEMLFDDLSAAMRESLVCPEDVDRLSGIPSPVWIWLRRLFFTGELERIALVLLKSRRVSAGSEVPDFIARELLQELSANRSFSFGDLQRIHHKALSKFLDERFGAQPAEVTALQHFRSFGSAGHRFAEFLYERPSFTIGEPPSATPGSLFEQPPLFEFQKPLDHDEASLFDHAPVSGRSRRWLSASEWEDLVQASHSLAPLADANVYVQKYSTYEPEIAEFVGMFRRFFPRHLRMLREDGRLTDFLRLVSLFGWVGILKLRLEENGSALHFPEFPVLPHSFEVWAGRMDRLDLFPNGAGPALAGLQRERFGSAVELVERVRRFHPDVRFRVIDWKFAVGDNRDRMITKEEILPLAHHDAQVQWYLLWLTLGEHLSRAGSNIGEWPDSGHLFGELRYILPDGEIVCIPVDPASDELRERFRSEVVARWSDISMAHHHRVLSNGTVRLLKSEIPEQEEKKESASLPPPQGRSLIKSTGTGPVSALVSAFREFTGEADLIEVVHTKGEVRYRMHLDRLERAIAARQVVVGRNFSWDRGGFIGCVFHREKTPSLNVNLRKGFWHCFGCNRSGGFERAGLSKEILLAMPSAQQIERRKNNGIMSAFEVPDLCRRIMADAQEILDKAFPWSAAEAYLHRVRGIDPRLAKEAGAGCGSDRLIPELLDRGYSFEELVSQRFINFSERADPNGFLPRLLKKRGIAPDVFARKRTLIASVTKTRREIVEYPFPVLSGFATFPLELPLGSEAVIVGFYGRKIPRGQGETAKSFKHIFLSPDEVPKGMFGGREVSSWIADGGIEKVYLGEAAIDALSLRALGYGVAIAINGTGSNDLEQLLVELNPGEINLTTDFDKPGRDAVERIEKSLRSKGYKGEIGDFSFSFALNHPAVAQFDCKDFNNWLTRVHNPSAHH